MKTTLITKVLVFFIICTFLGSAHSTYSTQTYQELLNPFLEEVDITCTTYDDHTILDYQLPTVHTNEVIIDDTAYLRVSFFDEAALHTRGVPDLPTVSRSIIIPDQQHMQVTLLQAEYSTLTDVAIAPSKGPISREIDPDTISYEFADVYDEDAWFPSDIATLHDPYILRDYRGIVVTLVPFQYNPVRRELRVYHQVSLEVTSNGQDTVNILTRNAPPNTIDSGFHDLYSHHFLNYGTTPRYTPLQEQGDMLILSLIHI